MINNYFITGMGRSGTTLLEKLLSNHSQLSILSQPFPVLFVGLKKIFLNLKGIKKYYVLNDLLNNSSYDIEEFNKFLATYLIDNKWLNELFKCMNGYSGQMTKIDLNESEIYSKQFIEVYNFLVKQYSHNKKAEYFGSKEILCEEYLPYMVDNNVKSTIIIRNPKDVLASANYPKGEKYLGSKKPTLFLLRSWRKSVEFTQYLSNHKNFHFLKYEELVKNLYEELNRITKFLGIKNFRNGQFKNGIYNQKGELWPANSSFNNSTSFVSQNSVIVYKKVLSDEEIAYTEAICKKEMLWLGYDFEYNNIDKEDIIRSFRDSNIENSPNLTASFSSKQENIDFEIKRANV